MAVGKTADDRRPGDRHAASREGTRWPVTPRRCRRAEHVPARRGRAADDRQPLPSAAPDHVHPAAAPICRSGFSKAGNARRSRSWWRSGPSSCSDASPTASGRTRRAPTSAGSAQASSSGRRSGGRTSSPASSRSSRSTFCVSTAGTLESDQLRRQRHGAAGAGHGHRAQHSVGQRRGADGVIWLLGAVIVWRVGRAHISATYVVAFLCSHLCAAP